MLKYLATAIGLVFIIEGLPYFAFPELMQRMLKEVGNLPPGALRLLGLVFLCLGLALCYLTQRTHLFG